MNIHSFAFLIILLCCLASCKLRIDNRPEEQETDFGSNYGDPSTPPVLDELPPLEKVSQGTYALLVNGKVSPFLKGIYRGEATFANTNTPVINANGISGNVKRELSFLYSQGLIRKMKIYFSSPQLEVRDYPLLSYSNFRKRLPEDSVAATYSIASNYYFESEQGSLEIHKLSEQQMEGAFFGNFISERGDTIQVSVNFKAIRE